MIISSRKSDSYDELRSGEAGQNIIAWVRNNLRAMILLSGSVRPTRLGQAIQRSILDLPIDDNNTVLDNWHHEAVRLIDQLKLDDLPVRVMIDHESALPVSGPDDGCMIIERDYAAFRGTGGVLHDLSREYEHGDYLLVASGAQIIVEELANLVVRLADMRPSVSIVSHNDGTLSGLMLIRCDVLDKIPSVGFIDMKEQALPKIAANGHVGVVSCDKPTGLPIRTLADYIRVLRWRQDRLAGKTEIRSPYDEHWNATFSIVEKDAIISDNARIHDSVVLAGGHVESGAVLVSSIVCSGGRVPRNNTIANDLITENKLRSMKEYRQ